MNLTKRNKKYVSEIDNFLQDFDRKNPKRSTSQQLEEKKFARIFRLRDNMGSQEKADKIWDEV